jgi:signal transduction histidine kinase
MMGYLDLARRHGDFSTRPKAAQYLSLAREAGQRLNQMFSNILETFRFERGNVSLNKEPVCLADVFEGVQRLFAGEAALRKVKLSYELPERSAPRVAWADPNYLHRVLHNLVGNALKFTPAGGSVQIRAKRGPRRVIIEVRDTGRGIPAEKLPNIFEKFNQVEPADSSCGYGLGLALTKHIVEAHGGEIRVDSVLGHGSRFTFWFPNGPAQVRSADPRDLPLERVA